MDTSELSSLRWLTSIKVPMQGLPVDSPLRSVNTTPASTPSANTSVSELDSNHSSPYLAVPPRKRKLKLVEKPQKPNCSYSCLIGMAMKASGRKSLPVCAIYRFIENEYPYYKTAPDGWKVLLMTSLKEHGFNLSIRPMNSIRHNLSLNRAFRKVEQPEGMKKGCQWGMNPSREAFLEHEMNKWLQEDNKSWDVLSSKYGTSAGVNSPMYCNVERPGHLNHDSNKKRMSQVSPEDKHTTQPLELQVLSFSNNPMLSSNDPLLNDPDITDAIAALQTVVAEEVVSTSYSPPTKQPFDLNESPSKYTLSCPLVPQDENGVAKSLFGLDLSPPKTYWNIYPCYNLYNREYKSYLSQLEEKQAAGDLDSVDDDIINNQYIMKAMKQLQSSKSDLPDLSYFEQLSEQTSGVLQHQDVECVNEMQLDNMVLTISRDFLTSSPHRQLDVSEELKNL